MDYRPPSPSLLKLAGMALLALVPVVYGVIALNTGDLLWVSPVFNAQPEAIVIHCFGQDVPLEPGSAPFGEITNLVNAALSGRKRWDSLTLSDATYQDYQVHPDMLVVELFYSQDVRVHSPYKFFSKVDTLIIPLEGRHAEFNSIFARRRGKSTAGSFHVPSLAPLVDYQASAGLCRQP